MTEQEHMELNHRYVSQLDVKQIIAEFEKKKSNNRLGPSYKIKTKLRSNWLNPLAFESKLHN